MAFNPMTFAMSPMQGLSPGRTQPYPQLTPASLPVAGSGLGPPGSPGSAQPDQIEPTDSERYLGGITQEMVAFGLNPKDPMQTLAYIAGQNRVAQSRTYRRKLRPRGITDPDRMATGMPMNPGAVAPQFAGQGVGLG